MSTHIHPVNLVGVDVGGTKTEILVEASDGRVRHALAASASWRDGQILSDPDNAARLLNEIRRLGPLGSETRIVVGAHGCDTPQQQETFTTWLQETHAGPVTVVNDAVLLGPAMGHDRSLQVVIGTGSIVTGATSDGHPLSVGGHGHLLGDPGSAPALVRDTIIALTHAIDRDPHHHDIAIAILFEAFGVTNVSDLTYLVTDDSRAVFWGAHAPRIFRAASDGSALASQVVKRAAVKIANALAVLISRGAVGDVVVLAGGVVSNQPSYFVSIARAITATIPRLRVELLTQPPALGALHMARAQNARETALLATSTD